MKKSGMAVRRDQSAISRDCRSCMEPILKSLVCPGRVTVASPV